MVIAFIWPMTWQTVKGGVMLVWAPGDESQSSSHMGRAPDRVTTQCVCMERWHWDRAGCSYIHCKVCHYPPRESRLEKLDNWMAVLVIMSYGQRITNGISYAKTGWWYGYLTMYVKDMLTKRHDYSIHTALCWGWNVEKSHRILWTGVAGQDSCDCVQQIRLSMDVGPVRTAEQAA